MVPCWLVLFWVQGIIACIAIPHTMRLHALHRCITISVVEAPLFPTTIVDRGKSAKCESQANAPANLAQIGVALMRFQFVTKIKITKRRPYVLQMPSI